MATRHDDAQCIGFDARIVQRSVGRP